MFLLSYLSKLKKNHIAYKKDKLLIDYRIYDRKSLWDSLMRYITTDSSSDYNIGFWQYTNDSITYTDYYCNSEDAKEIERLIHTMAI